jgi:hypothetical protein
MLLAILAVAVCLGYRERMRNLVDKKLLVRQMISTELMRRHWESTESSPSLGGMIAGIANELNQTNSRTATIEVLRTAPGVIFMTAKRPAHLSKIERDALSRVDDGEPEIWDVAWNGDVRYIGVVKSTGKCSACHIKTGTGGDLGVIRVDVRQK